MKVHKDHLDTVETVIPPCKVNYDANAAKDMLLLAQSAEDQQVMKEEDHPSRIVILILVFPFLDLGD